jgi:hypothetical protein
MNDLVYRLRERARIRRQIPSRKSVQEGAADRLSDLLEEAANGLQDKQGQIDALMLEYCVDDMSEEQLDEWARHQKPFKLAFTTPHMTNTDNPIDFPISTEERMSRFEFLSRFEM